MKEERFWIGAAPAVLYGEPQDRLFIFVHGQCGCKEEGERFARIVADMGYQVLGVDLPEHGGRTDGARLLPWVVVDELKAVLAYAGARWKRLSLRAISIGAWLSMQAFVGADMERCLFSSPLLDMEGMIFNLMRGAGVSEARLQAEGEIQTEFGQLLSWDYLCWVRQHPARAICRNTALLYAEGDEMIDRASVEGFAEENGCRMTVYEGGQHWLHTPQELAFMERWERAEIAGNDRRRIYMDAVRRKACIGVFIKDAEVILAGTTVHAMPVKHKNEEYERFSEAYDIRFIFEDDVPQIDFYTVPMVEIFAVDSAGGYIGSVGQPADLQANIPICYIDKDRNCYWIADNGGDFLKTVDRWKENMKPYAGIDFLESIEVAQAKYAFLDGVDGEIS